MPSRCCEKVNENCGSRRKYQVANLPKEWRTFPAPGPAATRVRFPFVPDLLFALLHGNPERHEYELYLAVEDIDHSRTKTKSPQTNRICERFHKTVLNELYRVAFRKKVNRSRDELQTYLDS